MFTGTIVGNLGRDAETKTIGQSSVVEFNVASTSKVKGEDHVTWAKCSYWGKRGESVAQYLLKGKMVAVTGEVKLRNYTKKDGTQGASLELEVSSLKLCGSKGDGAPVAAGKPSGGGGYAADDYGSTDDGEPLPF